MSLDTNDPHPPYVQVANLLRSAIKSGDLKPGDKLPSGSELAEQYGVSRQTIQNALRKIRDEGLTVSWQGRGVFVRDRDAENADDSDEGLANIFKKLDAILERVEGLESQVASLEAKKKSR